MDRNAIRHLGSINRDERRRGEKQVRQKLKPGKVFYTGTGGSQNEVAEVVDKNVYVLTSKGKQIRFSLESIIRAGTYLYRVRKVERKELEVFHPYNSTLFAILSYVFHHITKVLQIKRFLRLVLKGVRFFLAGAERSPCDLRIAIQEGAKYVLFSYFHIRHEKSWLKNVQEMGLRVLLDSGAFSLYMANMRRGRKVADITLDEYCDFIQKHKNILEGYFVLDVIGDYQRTKQNLFEMEKSGLSPIPIFHLGTPLSELQELVDRGYPVIGLGGTVNQPMSKIIKFLSQVFYHYPNQLFHGLGISRPRLITEFPFFTADSRTWINGRTRGTVVHKGVKIKNPLAALAENVKFLAQLEDPEFYESLIRREKNGKLAF